MRKNERDKLKLSTERGQQGLVQDKDIKDNLEDEMQQLGVTATQNKGRSREGCSP